MVDPERFRQVDEVARARELARRFGCDFVDLHRFSLKEEILKRVPAELMFRFNFVPLEETPDGRLAISIADPSQLLLIDEISLLLGRRLVVLVAALSQISEVLRRIDPHAKEAAENPPDDPLGGLTILMLRFALRKSPGRTCAPGPPRLIQTKSGDAPNKTISLDWLFRRHATSNSPVLKIPTSGNTSQKWGTRFPSL